MWKKISTYSEGKLKLLHIIGIIFDWLFGFIAPIFMIIYNYFIAGNPDNFTKGLYVLAIIIVSGILMKFVKKHFIKNKDYWNVSYKIGEAEYPDGILVPKVSTYIIEMLYGMFGLFVGIACLYFFKTGFDVAYRTALECVGFVVINKVFYFLFTKFVEEAIKNDEYGKDEVAKEIKKSNYINKKK